MANISSLSLVHRINTTHKTQLVGINFFTKDKVFDSFLSSVSLLDVFYNLYLPREGAPTNLYAREVSGHLLRVWQIEESTNRIADL